ncbi:NYN domain-containing protein [Jatrophihabitans sp.]|uniref:NYN domain-containing protein n=1 Tax=Jatrophihabitans sp. TaxID=1932789 RepID=UPI0030C67FC2|nr:hypothetical protein [Jatrophihabitans sp.]
MSERVQRVIVFLDWQNVYRQARESFHSKTDDFVKGQVNPLDLALTLAERAPEGITRELTSVRIYRGLPDNKFDPKAYDAARRQISTWQRDQRVVVNHRKLRYPSDWVKGKSDPSLVKEKGIDVALAIDFAAMATDGQYDVGILMSCDNDLLPALERVEQRRKTRGDGPAVEVAAWKSPFRRSPRLSFQNSGGPFCHWLDQETYWGLTDERDYTTPSPLDVHRRR